MRTIIIIFLLLVLSLQGLLFLIFTSSGNHIILPYLNSYLAKKTPKVKIEIQKFRLRPDSISMTSKINNTIELRAQGNIDLFSQQFDINYTLDTNEIKTPTLSIKERIKIFGTAKGNMNDMKIYGNGFALDSTIRYKLSLLNNYPKNIQIAIKDANIKSLLVLAGQKPYSSGKLSLQANMPEFTPLNPKIFAKLSIKDAAVNSKLVENDFNITLPIGTKYTSSLVVNTKNSRVEFDGSLNSTLANLAIKDGAYHLLYGNMEASYKLDIADLAKLKPIVAIDIRGKFVTNGKVSLKKKKLIITGHGKEFGGSIDFTLQDSILRADATGVTVSKLMHMLDYPQVLDAISKAKVNYNLDTDSGTLHATLDNARLLPSQLTKALKQFQIIDLTKEKYNNSRFDAKISKEKIDFTLEAKSKNSYIRIPQGRLIKKSNAINAKINLKIKGKDLQATIRGTTNNPKVSLDGSKYLENKVKDKLKKKFGDDIKKAKNQVKSKIKKNLGKW
ncbi:MAG: hypothetical protein HF962_06535 [Sulfurovum sp.]|nr:hypothetical protein [Sulfurovum sp.]